MSILTKEELLAKINTLTGEDVSDDTLNFLESVSETYDSMNDSEIWKAKYEENDAEWRKKYKERFESPSQITSSTEPEPPEEEEKTKFEDLFEVK